MAGYFIQSGEWKKFKSKYSRQIETLITMNKMIFLILTSILLLQTSIFDLMPRISAIEASLIHSLMSIQFCKIILDNSLNNKIKTFFSISLWKELRYLARVSYIFHPLIFNFISLSYPPKNNNLIELIKHMYVTFIINFLICNIIHIKIEKPIINLSEKISNSILFK